jgi:cytochrome c peroxidase
MKKILDTTKPEPLLDGIARGSAPGVAVTIIAAAFGIALAIGDAAGAANSSPALTRIAILGERIFNDSGLSASGRLACSTCHVANSGHAESNDASVPLGGPNGDTQGFRNAPSLRYLNTNRAFTFDKEGTPTGGFNRDGRAASLMEQARRPLLAPHEMANASPAELVARLARADYADEFRLVFGAGIFDRPDDAFDRIVLSLAQYQKEDPDFHPFDSKFDQFLAGKLTLSDQELRGLALFNRRDKGNCAACHPSTRGADGAPPLFTDFTYDNLGVPRNYDIPANADPAYFDLGLCGPDRQDLTNRKDLCGAFRVPTLRNVATTSAYFHNGKFKRLKDVVAFYVRRDTHPDEWYPRNSDGSVRKFDDLPIEYQNNVNITEAPYNRHPGDEPALNTDEIDDVVAFLNTLTDGHKP